MTRLVGIEGDSAALGVPFVHLQDVRVVTGSLGEDPVVVFWQPGAASALDGGDGWRGWAAVAAELGYADQAHLTRDFRRHLGTSPSAYLARTTRPPG